MSKGYLRVAHKGEEKTLQTIYLRQVEFEIGILSLASTERGLCRVDFPGKSQEMICQLITKAHGPCEFWDENVLGKKSLINQRTQHQLKAYFDQKLKEFSLPLDIKGTDFQLSVWHELGNIPYGKTVSYKDIAQAIGNPKAFRAVGGANNKNPIAIIIPCHRVLGHDGSLIGFGGGLAIKQYLLDLEVDG